MCLYASTVTHNAFFLSGCALVAGFFTLLQLLNQFEPIEKGESETFAIPHWLPTGKYCQSDFYHEVTLCQTLCFGLTTEREHLICKQKPVSQPAKTSQYKTYL